MGLFDDTAADTRDGGGLLPTGGPTGSGGVLPRPAEPRVIVQAPPGTTLDSIPAPYQPVSDGELTQQEEDDLVACEAGVDNLRTAFWVAGKSLDTMKSANLTRKRHPNFAKYVWDKWEISESQMHRLIEEWRLGEALAKRGRKPLESHVRKLFETGFVQQHGNATAIAAYEGVAQAVPKVTARLIEAVATNLPGALDGDAANLADVTLVTEKAKELASAQKKKPSRPSTANKGDDSGKSNGQGAHGAPTSPQGEGGLPNGDLEALTAAVTCLNGALNQMQGQTAVRALRNSPEQAGPLVEEITLKLGQLAQALPEGYRG